ncbi:hypothetical protein SFR_5167 [Streptomyces sp. FR-008]|nr:hypothetical protein SFR_5167 [Streptomyces sp. FR-008]
MRTIRTGTPETGQRTARPALEAIFDRHGRTARTGRRSQPDKTPARPALEAILNRHGKPDSTPTDSPAGT